MENAWIGWIVTVLGWLLSPIIGLLLNKILSYLGSDASQKLRELKIHTIPNLRSTLKKAEKQRMLKEANNERSDVDILDKLASMLKSDLYESEDILDLIDYHRIEKKVVGDGWLLRLYDAVGTCISRCKRTWLGRWTQKSLFLLGRWAQQRLLLLERWARQRLYATLHRSAAPLPICCAPTISSVQGRWAQQSLFLLGRWAQQSLFLLGRWAQQRLLLLGRWAQQSLYATLHRSAARPPISCPPSISSVQRLCCWSRSFDFNSSCRSIFVWLDNKIEVACYYRDWSYEVVGITSYQEDAIAFLPIISRLNLKKRIEKIENNVTNVQKSPLLDLPSNSVPNDIADINRSRIRSTTTREVFGREKDRDKIIKMLRQTPSSRSSARFSVIGIHGIAGSGKTTLAQYVRDYEKEAKDKYFDPIMCIHVSETFRVDDIFHDMLEQVTKDRHSNIEDREDLKLKLEENLRDKRFFLVLDDLWVKENYQELLSPLNVGKRGSKILVTSRRKDAAGALGAKNLIPISELKEEHYFSMFMHYALGDTSFDNPKYTRIGRKIVKRLHRSPIAAVTVAGQLGRNLDINFWETTANLDQLNQTMGALQWCYQQLDVDIRRCFAYCSIFPRRYELERDMLVHMWIAQGFVKANSREDIADVGQNYFHQLQSCLFLQLERKIRRSESEVDSGEYFRIHDLLHDLAERVAGSDCLRIEKGEIRIPEQILQDVHHLCIVSYGEIVIPEQILEMKNLRTLIMCYSVKNMSKEDFERVLMRLRKLRVVRVELQLLGTIPACIGELKHLRYLGVFADDLHDINLILPPEFTKLYHLQELSVWFLTRLHCSSKEKMSNLINLRNVSTFFDLDFPDIGRLTSLRTLYRFYVRNERGYEIQQLEHLNSLRGTLSIEHLENVKSKEEALQAKLADKEHLADLRLRWGGLDDKKGIESFNSCSPELQTEVLEGLHPPSQITSLSIIGYGGLRYPSWLSRERCTSLKELSIEECPNIESLPPLPPYLKRFTLINCNRSLTESCEKIGHPNWRKIDKIRHKARIFIDTKY